MVYEIYEMPNGDLDGSEVLVTEAPNLVVANQLFIDLLSQTSEPLCILEIDTENDTERMVRS